MKRYHSRRAPDYGDSMADAAGEGYTGDDRKQRVGACLPIEREEQTPEDPHPANDPANLIPAIIDAWSAGAKTAGSAFGPVV